MTIDQTHLTPQSHDTDQLAAGQPTAGHFVAYEYFSVRAPRELESLYQDTYRGFGWTTVGVELADPVRVTLKLKRDRAIRNRQLVQELQRKADKSLAAIARLEQSKRTFSVATSIGFGIAGSALLAGSMFTMNAGLILLSILLGAAGLLLWLGGFIAHHVVKNKRTAKVAPLIDSEHDVLYETSGQASRLLG